MHFLAGDWLRELRGIFTSGQRIKASYELEMRHTYIDTENKYCLKLRHHRIKVLEYILSLQTI